MAIKRSQFAQFFDTTPSSNSPTWGRLGKGVTSGAWAYNKQVETETYIHEDTATSDVEGEQPSMAVSQKAFVGDPVFTFVDAIRRSHATGEDCETDMLLVYIYDADSSTPVKYGAEKQRVAIQVDDFGGDGGKSNVLNYTVLAVGDPIPGKVTMTDGVPTFTADS